MVAHPGANPVPDSSCMFWRTTVWTAQHQRTCRTACGRHQRWSLVEVSLLCWHHDTAGLVASSGYPWRLTAPFPWLQRGHGTVCTRDSGLLLTSKIPKGHQASPFSSVIRLDLAQSISTISRRLRWASCNVNYLSCYTEDSCRQANVDYWQFK